MAKKFKVNIEPHDGCDKRFEMNLPNDLCLYVDYDDVDHASVDAASKVLKEVVEKHWDEALFQKLYKEEIMKIWDANESDIQEDYEGDLKTYLADYNLIDEAIY